MRCRTAYLYLPVTRGSLFHTMQVWLGLFWLDCMLKTLWQFCACVKMAGACLCNHFRPPIKSGSGTSEAAPLHGGACATQGSLGGFGHEVVDVDQASASVLSRMRPDPGGGFQQTTEIHLVRCPDFGGNIDTTVWWGSSPLARNGIAESSVNQSCHPPRSLPWYAQTLQTALAPSNLGI